MGSPIWWGFSFCLSGSSLEFRWRYAPLLCEFQMWGHRCKQWVSRWFQGHKMRFHGIWSTISSYNSMIYSARLMCTTAISLGPSSMPFKTLEWLLSLPVDHSQQPVALKWDRESIGLVSAVFFRKIFVLRINICFFLIKKYSFQTKWNDIKIQNNVYLLTNVRLVYKGEGSSNRNARDESVETGDESVETRDGSIEAGENTQQSCYNC